MSTPLVMLPIFTSSIETERDVVLARQRASHLAELLGLDLQDRARIATAVSEIARNAYNYAGEGRVEFAIASGAESRLVISISDRGPGIPNLDEVLQGRYTSSTGMGLGMIGAKRLMDEFAVETGKGEGTVVRMTKKIPPRLGPLTPQRVTMLAGEMTRAAAFDPSEEVRRQNRELMTMLDELGRRQQELATLNRELEDTNRGVVALYAELDERAERLRESDEIKSRFLSHMSHEFRTPLSSILALSRLLLDRTDGDLTSEQQKQVEYIRRSAAELSELVNDLLDLAKVESGRIELSIETFAVDSLFGALRGVMKPLVSSDAVALNFSLAGVAIEMTSDESKVGQILRNLISNALKFTESGEVAVAAERSEDGSMVIFTVRDTGVGIAPEDLDIIFEEFGQARNRLQRRVKGTGLGLPLSRRLAALLGGTLTVTSVPGEGSVFTLMLPVRLANGDAPSPTSAAREPARDLCRALVVDDEPSSRYLLRRLLEEQQCAVVEASCGTEGLERATGERPNIIFLDVVMPDLTGIDVAERLRRNPATSDIPTYIVTSKVLTDEERASLTANATAIVAKESLSREIIRAIVDAHATRSAGQPWSTSP